MSRIPKKGGEGNRQSSTRVVHGLTQGRMGGQTSPTTLSPLEEKVVRMRHGLSESDEAPLEFAVGASEDTRMRLALMEAYNIGTLGEAPTAEPRSEQTATLLDMLRKHYGASEDEV